VNFLGLLLWHTAGTLYLWGDAVFVRPPYTEQDRDCRQGEQDARGSELVFQQQEIDRPQGVEFERHYSAGEIGKLWNLSGETIRTMFENEPGVLRIGEGDSRKKRAYFTMRVPESVMRRVHQKWRTRSERTH
jgi:hypothetical protein